MTTADIEDLEKLTISQVEQVFEPETDQLSANDLFLFSRSGYEGQTDTGYCSSKITYGDLGHQLSNTLGIPAINAELNRLDADKLNRADLMKGHWVRTLNNNLRIEEIYPFVLSNYVIAIGENGWTEMDSFQDPTRTLADEVNPRFINDIYEESGGILSLDVMDLSASVRTAFDSINISYSDTGAISRPAHDLASKWNTVSKLIPQLAASKLTKLTGIPEDDRWLYILSSTTDNNARVQSVAAMPLSTCLSVCFDRYELSDISPTLFKNLGGVFFRDYVAHQSGSTWNYDKTDSAGKIDWSLDQYRTEWDRNIDTPDHRMYDQALDRLYVQYLTKEQYEVLSETDQLRENSIYLTPDDANSNIEYLAMSNVDIDYIIRNYDNTENLYFVPSSKLMQIIKDMTAGLNVTSGSQYKWLENKLNALKTWGTRNSKGYDILSRLAALEKAVGVGPEGPNPDDPYTFPWTMRQIMDIIGDGVGYGGNDGTSNDGPNQIGYPTNGTLPTATFRSIIARLLKLGNTDRIVGTTLIDYILDVIAPNITNLWTTVNNINTRLASLESGDFIVTETSL